MLRLSLGYLLSGWLLGGLVLCAPSFPILMPLYRFRPVHIELMQMGWLVNFVFGVAYWIFPRVKHIGRPRKAWAYAAFVSLQMGILCCILYHTCFSSSPALFLTGRLLQFSAFVAFFVHLQPRVRPFGAHP